ncbi:MAG: DNA/RNA non-specific endonuclease [Acidobacteriota bacterium]
MPNALRSPSRTRLFILMIATLFGVSLFFQQMYFPRRVQAISATVVISEFRVRGPSGGNDEFIELYNLTNNPINIGGWKINGSNNAGTASTRVTINAGTIIPARGHFLATNSGASGYSGSVPGNQTYGTGVTDDGGIALLDASSNIVDQVGMSAGSAYKEGTTLPTLGTTSAANLNRGYERKPGGASGSTQDTDNNSVDFQVLTPSNPQNLSSTPTPNNQAIVPNCPTSLTTAQGTATSAGVSATDPDGTVTSATITSANVPGITLDGFTAAGGIGGAATATLNVANTTAAGDYDVTIQYQNNDSPTPQSATCIVEVTVTPPNQGISPSCPGTLNVDHGSAGSTGVSASDPDGTVTSAAITSPSVAGISLDSFSPAGASGGTASATLNVANTTALGTYNVDIQWTNNDSPTPQTATCTVVVSVQVAHGAVVISQVYGGGGNAGSTLKNDYIEIVNHSSNPVDLGGWSVQARATAGPNSSAWSVTPLPSFVLQPGQYFLIQESQGAGGTENLPTPDAVGTIPVSSTSGKVALVSNTTALTLSCPTGSGIIDFVGYGNTLPDNTVDCFEGAGQVPTLSNTTAAFRKDDGCFDTDDNAKDFLISEPSPRNSSSPFNDCTGLTGFGSANPSSVLQGESTTLTVYLAPAQAPPSTGVTVTANLSQIDGSPTQVFSGGPNTFTFVATIPADNATGMKSLPVTISDDQLRTASTTIMVSVLPLIPDHVTISQLYGGGGNSGATFNHDYVELHNPHTSTTFNLTGWSIQYASAAGVTWQVQPLAGTIAPGEYYLVALGTNNSAVGSPLPPANINGDINMSATNGKVALVSNFDELAGFCPLGNPVVDFVGYGTANCSETAAAPTPGNNTTSLFRKNNGARDSDNNSADFVTGIPAPRKTAPTVEIGPFVFATDPRNGATTAPRDATITISFTEPVTVDDGWYDITCVTSGNHNSATVRSFFGGDTHTITPNVNFVAGEQCTVTIFKHAVHDVDSDDPNPNADTLLANKVFTFTVATGTAPPYTSDVHLTMGNPSGSAAVSDNNYLMDKPEFTLSYNRSLGTANWVSWHLADEWVGTLERVDTFRADPAVPADWFRVSGFDYVGSGFDRGHMVPNADRDKETSTPINQATFLMTNIIPQAPDNNQGPWANMEGYLRTQVVGGNEIYIVAGGAGTGGTGSNGAATTIAGGNVTVPAQTWKVALIMPKATGDDVARVSCSTRTLAVIMPNVQGIRNDDWQDYITTVDAVEALTGYDFFSNLPDAVENCVEAGTNGTNPPGTANQSATTVEDTPVNITLEAVRSNSNTLTFSIVSGPSEGSLGPIGPVSCSGGSCTATVTYTPNLNYSGPDSFTFKASDGPIDSNVSTVNITVLPDTDGDGIPNVNDLDDDNDGVPDVDDNCDFVVNPDQADFDVDGIGDSCDQVVGPPVNKDQCKNGGWRLFNSPSFPNQGQCVAYVNALP